MKRITWDFALMLATLALLASLGVQSLAGTLYVWWAQRADADWMRTGYDAYVAAMNAVAFPQLVALVTVLGLCVPKRLFARRPLVAVSVAMLAAGGATWAATGSVETGLGVYLALACTIQIAVVALTLANAPSLRYLTEGRVVKAGSGLLHLGFLLLGLATAALRGTAALMPVFALAALLLLAGSWLAFFPPAVSPRTSSGTGTP